MPCRTCKQPHCAPWPERRPPRVAVSLLCTCMLTGCAGPRRLPAPTGGAPKCLTELPRLITESVRLPPGRYFVPGSPEHPALTIVGDDITVDFQDATLTGAPDDAAPDTYVGKGIVVHGRSVTLLGAHVHGYRVGVYAESAPGLTITRCDLARNFRQHLGSTIEREDSSDWLYPHRNDAGEWAELGAGVYLKNCAAPTISRCRIRNGQNGIVLDCVHEAAIYDNDCSFLSGWGLALWRSSRNAITRNAFDFCIRGYSHGVYNRGQDSAGILMFEQCCDNLIAENSATHCGDGLFAFAGREALGEDWLDAERERLRAETGKQDVDDLIEVPEEIVAAHRRKGNNCNQVYKNDFSYAAAHGLELTFSFDNFILENRFEKNAICGIWGGYSQDTVIRNNRFIRNGDAGYGLERGGVNIEHGRGNWITDNRFEQNTCGVHLWSDDDAGILKLPWAVANHQGSVNNFVIGNNFTGDRTAIHLRDSYSTTLLTNSFHEVGEEVNATPGSEPVIERELALPAPQPACEVPSNGIRGETHPVGARAHLTGRHDIFMTEWGPYDFTDIRVSPEYVTGGASAKFYLLAPGGEYELKGVTGDVQVMPATGKLPAILTVDANADGVLPFTLEFDLRAGVPRHFQGRGTDSPRASTLHVKGLLVRTTWNVTFYAWTDDQDPRDNPQHWQQITAQEPLAQMQTPTLDFAWRNGRPADNVPPDHFATVAATQIDLPAGQWRITTLSDDGIRVFVDGEEVLANWTHHAPTRDEATVTLTASLHDLRVEHFEIDGYARLELSLERSE